MFWGSEHVSQVDCEGYGGKGKHDKDENVSNVSSDNERLTKEMFSVPSSIHSWELSVSLCSHNLNKYEKMWLEKTQSRVDGKPQKWNAGGKL